MGAFVPLNNDGWILTAAHVFNSQAEFEQHKVERADRERKVATVNANARFNAQQKQREIRRLPVNPNWLTNLSFWFGADGAVAAGATVHLRPLADLALVKLDGLPPSPTYPVFGNRLNPISPGTSLCRLGFPFNAVDVTWDATGQRFVMANANWPLFPLEGMMTRWIHVSD